MIKHFITAAIVAATVLLPLGADAKRSRSSDSEGATSTGETTQVRGYIRRDGTYVAPHVRSAPDGNFNNNWTTKGNVNPYTGQAGTRVTPPNSYYSAPTYYAPPAYQAPRPAAAVPATFHYVGETKVFIVNGQYITGVWDGAQWVPAE